MRMWRNWQTRYIQVLVTAMSYGFKSLHPHQKLQNIRSVAFLFVEEPVFVG